mgnify:FL=1
MGFSCGELVHQLTAAMVGQVWWAGDGSEDGKNGGYRVHEVSSVRKLSAVEVAKKPQWKALCVRMQLKLADGSTDWWTALVDTGAAVCVVSPRKAPPKLQVAAEREVSFRGANGAAIAGGDKGM